ncbi:hypothetical protein ATANTOWER_000679 [Ataeniobius toweri]|uniref:Peptidase aspartic putative domain-containing protein n=1 Tax=Ataeniobius toweri TaxID=208326 RepID=A0ABU7ALV4_9TELE|nr:hypothetical protein [Ataeniobius toweri]
MDHTKIPTCPRLILPAKILLSHSSHELTALVDSGCERDLIDSTLVEKLGIRTVQLSTPLRAEALDGKELPRITHRTEQLQLVLSVRCSPNLHTDIA